MVLEENGILLSRLRENLFFLMKLYPDLHSYISFHFPQLISYLPPMPDHVIDLGREVLTLWESRVRWGQQKMPPSSMATSIVSASASLSLATHLLYINDNINDWMDTTHGFVINHEIPSTRI